MLRTRVFVTIVLMVVIVGAGLAACATPEPAGKHTFKIVVQAATPEDLAAIDKALRQSAEKDDMCKLEAGKEVQVHESDDHAYEQRVYEFSAPCMQRLERALKQLDSRFSFGISTTSAGEDPLLIYELGAACAQGCTLNHPWCGGIPSCLNPNTCRPVCH